MLARPPVLHVCRACHARFRSAHAIDAHARTHTWPTRLRHALRLPA